MGIREFVFACALIAAACGPAHAQVAGVEPTLVFEEHLHSYTVSVTDAFPDRWVFLFLAQVEGSWYLDLGIMGGITFDCIGPRGFLLGTADSTGSLAVSVPKPFGGRREEPLYAQAVSFNCDVRGVTTPVYVFQFALSPLEQFTLRAWGYL